MVADNKSIILFDGVCNLCNASVNFVIKHDKKHHFLFTSLQSDAGKKLLLQSNDKKLMNPLDSIVLIEKNEIYIKSTAVLRIAKKIGLFYSLSYIFILIPKCIRDYFYDVIAKRRYRWFGKKDSCMIPKEDDFSRFI